jgi:hypothetical protein
MYMCTAAAEQAAQKHARFDNSTLASAYVCTKEGPHARGATVLQLQATVGQLSCRSSHTFQVLEVVGIGFLI